MLVPVPVCVALLQPSPPSGGYRSSCAGTRALSNTGRRTRCARVDEAPAGCLAAFAAALRELTSRLPAPFGHLRACEGTSMSSAMGCRTVDTTSTSRSARAAGKSWLSAATATPTPATATTTGQETKCARTQMPPTAPGTCALAGHSGAEDVSRHAPVPWLLFSLADC
jgi:hypothetical protein